MVNENILAAAWVGTYSVWNDCLTISARDLFGPTISVENIAGIEQKHETAKQNRDEDTGSRRTSARPGVDNIIQLQKRGRQCE